MWNNYWNIYLFFSASHDDTTSIKADSEYVFQDYQPSSSNRELSRNDTIHSNTLPTTATHHPRKRYNYFRIKIIYLMNVFSSKLYSTEEIIIIDIYYCLYLYVLWLVLLFFLGWKDSLQFYITFIFLEMYRCSNSQKLIVLF